MRWLIVTLLAAVVLLRTGAAIACDDSPYGWQDITPAFAAKVPADGVLAFFLEGFGEVGDLQVEVRLGDSEPLAGTIEESGAHFLWRPAQPLVEGQQYSVQAHSDNSFTSGEDIEWSGTVTASAPLGPLRPEPRWDAITVRHWVELHPSTDLDDLVCCKGSLPRDSYCDSPSAADGCAPTRGTRLLHTEFTIDPSARAEALGQLRYLDFDGADNQVEKVAFSPSSNPCVVLRATDLISGELLEGPTSCPEAELVDELGEVDLDPREALPCKALQICEIDESGLFTRAWDPKHCRRWRGEGCGCIVSAPQPVGPIVLGLALLALARGRRSR